MYLAGHQPGARICSTCLAERARVVARAVRSDHCLPPRSRSRMTLGKSRITERRWQLREIHGTLIETSADLPRIGENPRCGAAGRWFSVSNLWRMKQFYETYSPLPKLATLLRVLSWSKHLLVLSYCKSEEEKEFYLLSAVRRAMVASRTRTANQEISV
jgi:DUF1016 N-terminal domain